MARFAIFLGALSIALTFVIGMVAARYGPHTAAPGARPTVADRFLERSTAYTHQELRAWANEYREAARRYVFPVMFPLDFLFMVSLGAFLAIGSMIGADAIERLRPFTALLLVLPIAYVLADLAEDLWLSHLLLSPEHIDAESVRWAKRITTVKFLTSVAAIGQTIVASAAGAWVEAFGHGV